MIVIFKLFSPKDQLNLVIFSLLFINPNPIILVPGAFRTRLAVSVTSQNNLPKCPQNQTYFPFWISSKMLLKGKINCLINWLTLDYDDKKQIITDQKNITVTPIDFGGIEGIRGTGDRIFGKSQPTYYEKIISFLKKKNYTVGENIFGAPYDWRYGVAQPPIFWENLTNLVEIAYNKTHKKIKFLTHSCGGCIIHKFLTNITTPEWRQKYIDSVIMSAPSFSGSGESLISLYRQRIPFIKFIRNDQVKEMVGSLGAFHVHIPNFIIFENTTVFLTPEGEIIKGKNLLKFLIKQSKLTEKQLKIAKQNIHYISSFPTSLDVPVKILYNSAIKTPFGLELKDWENEGKVIYRNGDGIVMSEGIEMACEKWKLNGTDIQCKDINSSSLFARHPFLILKDKFINVLLDWLIEPSNKTNSEDQEL